MQEQSGLSIKQALLERSANYNNLSSKRSNLLTSLFWSNISFILLKRNAENLFCD